MPSADGDDTSVRVAVRIRPQNAKEKIDMNQVCTSVEGQENQIFLGKDKAFTFDYVYDMPTPQNDVFVSVAKPLMTGCVDGYNATLLAYGQTGSGKTYTMGTGFDVADSNESVGIIPRAVSYLFSTIDERRQAAIDEGQPPPEFKVISQFLELYNEELIDLLEVSADARARCKSRIRIHEDANGGIYITGVSTRVVTSLEDTIKCLKDGALCRSTASTNMNSQSSRSHAIFTLYIRQQRVVKPEETVEDGKEPPAGGDVVDEPLPEFETLTAKFHFVDLAGSERLKRTGATGERAKEGISINCGLLALGNVISALGDVTKRGCHVPYRDSKLTRLLQDSLGGNSRTIMIACISPSDCDFMETLNTLKYANRARNIKNKVMLNQDKTSKQIAVLRSQIAVLEQELLEYKQGRRVINADGTEGVSDLCSENSYLQAENDRLRARIKALQQTMETLQARNAQLLADFELSAAGRSGSTGSSGGEGGPDEEFVRVVEKYTQQVEELRTKLAEAEAMSLVLQRSPPRPMTAPTTAGGGSAFAGASMTGSMYAMSSSSIMTSSMMSGANLMSTSFCGSIGASGGGLPRVAFSVGGEFPDTFADDEDTGYDSQALLDAAKQQVARQQQALSTKRTQKSSRKRTNAEGDDGVRAGSLSDEDAEEMDVDDEADAEDEDDDDEDEEEDEKEKENLQESLANLTNDISLKQRLIVELENKQRQLHAVRDHYERQMSSLMEKIRETESERDKVLANVSKVENSSEERVRRIREDFEKKLTNLQGELRRLNCAKREHNKMLRAQQRREQELMMLHRDLDDMKRLKVQLLKKVKEEAKRTRQVEMARDREVAQLRKEKRLKDTTIRNLELEKKQRDTVLRRKHEEVEMLRKRTTYRPPMPRPNSVGSTFERYTPQSSSARSSNATTPVSGTPRFPGSARSYRPTSGYQRGSASSRPGTSSASSSATVTRPGTSSQSSLRSAKVKWDNVERTLTSVVGRRQTVSHFEQDMQNWVQEREKLGRKMEGLSEKMKTATDKQEQVNLSYEITNIRAQLETAQEQISECQTNIIELEEARDEPNMQAMFSRCNLTEARYLLERLFEATVSKGLMAHQAEAESKETKAALASKAAEKEQALSMLRIALQQGSSGIPFDMEEILGPEAGVGGAGDSGENDNDPDSLSEPEQNGDTSNTRVLAQDRTVPSFTLESLSEHEAKKKQKARRLTQTPQELLGVERVPEPLPAMDSLDEETSPERLPDEVLMPPPSSVPATQRSSKSRKEPSSAGPSPATRRKQYGGPAGRPSTLPAAPNLMTTSLYLPRTSGNDSGAEATPPLTPPPGVSPTFTRGGSLRGPNSEANVFSRLTGGTSGRGSPGPTRGVIYAQTKAANSRSVFDCTHVAEGHTKAVLDLDVTGNYMITGSKDRTAKLWDLETMRETAILGAHHNNVTRVRYCPSQHLLFTVCSYYIKLWDDRATDKCIRTLLSSGLSQEGPPEVSQSLRQNICPPGETNIMDLVVSGAGDEMFLATANSVKLWDLRRFCAVGKLHGNHQAPVMVLALDRMANAHRVVTGSKDHYIKVFSVSPGACGLLTPSADLQPPHYDGIESLALRDNLLFSGSRDTNIKKWNLANPHQENVINNAHRDWIQGMCLLPVSTERPAKYLLSGCRAGVLKLWRCNDCACLGDVQAHTTSINAVRTNGRFVFTASNDSISAVKLWRVSDDL